MANIPTELKYTKEHEWVNIDGNVATVGITDFAQNSLGDIVFVELPAVGSEINAGDSLGAIESVKAAEDLYSPLSGKVVEVNEALSQDWASINREPYGAGWILKIEMKDVGEADSLMASGAYEQLVADAGH